MGILKRLKNLKITAKFMFWFLFIALLPSAIATYTSYVNAREILEREVANSIRAVADDKVHQVETYLREKEESVTDLSHRSDIVDAVERYSAAFLQDGGLESPECGAVDAEFRPFLTYYQKSHDYTDIFLVNADGYIIFSSNEEKEPRSLYEMVLYDKNSELAKTFIRAKESSKTEISDFEYNQFTQKAAAFIAAPVFNAADLTGMIILEMSNEGLFKFVQDYTGLGQTGDIVLATRIGKEVVVIAPLRYDPEAAFKRRIAIGSKEGTGIQKAVLGKEEVGVINDYRGKPALAVIRYIPSFRLGMVVKMDTSEVLASADKLRNILIVIGGAFLIIVVIMAFVIARSIASPIKALTRVSGIIAKGNLSARASIDAKDEIGELAESFNEMTDKLVEAKTDIEQKKKEVEEQKRLLEEVNKELDSFVYTASHDLRAPLRGISSFASFLEQDYKDKLDKEGKDYLKEIREGAERMNLLIEDLLKLSRISRIKNPYEDVSINDLIDSVTKRIKFDIQEKKVDLKVRQNMPIARCDRIKMEEVFLNLINNAVKFSSKNNKENPIVEVGYADAGEFHRFYVKDNGIGIDPKYHNEIFGLFRRLHTSEEYEGTGAGLSIVKRVIDDHGGNIWIESEPGKGAVFYFTIPKNPEAAKKEVAKS